LIFVIYNATIIAPNLIKGGNTLMKSGLIISMLLALCLTSAPLLSGANTALAADGSYNASFEAQFEVLPDHICWEYYNNGSGSVIDFQNSNLVINTTGENQYYYDFFYQESPETTAPAANSPWIVETRARFVSGSSSHIARTPMSVAVLPYANWGNILWIEDGGIFLLNGVGMTRGDSAVVNTTEFHVYTIMADSDDNVDVYVDDPGMTNTPALTGSLINVSGWPAQRISFGDGTNSARGVSEWSYIRHNFYNGICGIFLP